MSNYYSMPLSELGEATTQQYYKMAKAMRIAKARDKLELMDIISYPHMKADGQKMTHRKLYESALTEEFKKDAAVKIGDLRFK